MHIMQKRASYSWQYAVVDNELDFFPFLDDKREIKKEGVEKLEKVSVSGKARVQDRSYFCQHIDIVKIKSIINDYFAVSYTGSVAIDLLSMVKNPNM